MMQGLLPLLLPWQQLSETLTRSLHFCTWRFCVQTLLHLHWRDWDLASMEPLWPPCHAQPGRGADGRSICPACPPSRQQHARAFRTSWCNVCPLHEVRLASARNPGRPGTSTYRALPLLLFDAPFAPHQCPWLAVLAHDEVDVPDLDQRHVDLRLLHGHLTDQFKWSQNNACWLALNTTPSDSPDPRRALWVRRSHFASGRACPSSPSRTCDAPPPAPPDPSAAAESRSPVRPIAPSLRGARLCQERQCAVQIATIRSRLSRLSPPPTGRSAGRSALAPSGPTTLCSSLTKRSFVFCHEGPVGGVSCSAELEGLRQEVFDALRQLNGGHDGVGRRDHSHDGYSIWPSILMLEVSEISENGCTCPARFSSSTCP